MFGCFAAWQQAKRPRKVAQLRAARIFVDAQRQPSHPKYFRGNEMAVLRRSSVKLTEIFQVGAEAK